jgi:hypothetical protein
MNCGHSVHELIHDRIAELLPFGFKNLWFQVSGNVLNPLATALGYDIHDLIGMIDCSGLSFMKNGIRNILLKSWQEKLHLVISQYDVYDKDTQKREKWFRFEEEAAVVEDSRGIFLMHKQK